MVEISLDEFMRAFAFVRAVKKERPKEDVYKLLVDRLGAMIFWHEARRALPQTDIGDLNWFAMPKHVADKGVDLRINGWKVDVKTPDKAMMLDWPQCKRSDLFPKVRLDKACLDELGVRYRRPKLSPPVGLLDDPIVKVSGEVVGWIGIGTAEGLAGDSVVASRVEDQLASPGSLWTLLGGAAGPNIRLADRAWQKGLEQVEVKTARPRRVLSKPDVTLLPPRRTSRAA